MAFLHSDIYDKGLSELSKGNRLDICSQEPTTYAGATTTYTLGNKATPTVGNPADRAGGGREVAVSAISDGSVTGTGKATHWALSDTAGSRLLAAAPLSASQDVTSGNTFTLTAFKVGIPAPA